MPHLYLTADTPLSAVIEKLPRYLELSGINIRQYQSRPMPDAIALSLRTGNGRDAVSIYHAPNTPGARLAADLFRAFAQLPIGGELRIYPSSACGWPVTLVFRQEAVPDADALSRAIAHACAVFFRLPELPQLPEQPARLDSSGTAALRSFPSNASPMHHRIAADEDLSVLGRSGNWLIVRHQETVGFLPLERVKFS